MILRKNPDLSFINPKFKGNVYVDGQYTNGKKKDPQPFEKLVKWIVTPNKQRIQKKNDRYAPTVLDDRGFLNNSSNSITWLGHASFQVRLNNKVLLTDPVFFNVSPFLRRKHKQPCVVSEFKQIDYVLISHGHRDHLDKKTIQSILNYHPGVVFLCPLEIGKILSRWGGKNIQEAAWFQIYKTDDLKIIFLPAKHWNRRGPLDYNKTLWGSFAIYDDSNQHSIYFAGDTGFGNHFDLIHRELGKFDNCLLPIGAYKPRFMMKQAHMSPREAIEAFRILEGKQFVPMHFGTYDLADEPPSEGIDFCRQAFKEEKALGNFDEPVVGKPIEVL